MDTTRMGDVKIVANLPDCSTRHVYRLSDAGKMPRPTKLGALCRWNLTEIEAWVAAGGKPGRAAEP